MAGAERLASVAGRGSVRMTIHDAVREAEAMTAKVSADVESIMNGERGIPFVIKTARDAGEQAAGRERHVVFAAALAAAKAAIDKSDMAASYDSIHSTLASSNTILARAAARKGARDAFAELPLRTQEAGGKTLLLDMRRAAAKAAKDSLQHGTTNTDWVPTLAEIVIQGASETIHTGTSISAAALAFFCVSIRNTPLENLTDGIRDICEEIPKLAFPYGLDCMIVSQATSEYIGDAAEGHRGYQAVIRAAEKGVRKNVVFEASETVGRGAMEGIFSMLVTGAYATSKRDAFDAKYTDALAAACGAKPKGSKAHNSGQGFTDNVLSTLHKILFENDEHETLFSFFRNIEYKTLAANPRLAGLVSTYEAAHRAAYKTAGATAAGA